IERKLAGPGRPGSADEAGGRRWSAGRRSALRHWARAACTLAARGGSVNPASKGASQALWRLPPLHRPRALCEGLANLGRIAPRECGRLGCLKLWITHSEAHKRAIII